MATLPAGLTAHASYSLRLKVDGYGGPSIRVRRVSDDVEGDVHFDGNGVVSGSSTVDNRSDAGGSVTLSTFLAANSGTDDLRITTGYSQVSGEPDLTMGTASDQPYIAENGAFIKDPGSSEVMVWHQESGQNLNLSGMTGIHTDDMTSIFVGTSLAATRLIDSTQLYSIGDLGGGHYIQNKRTRVGSANISDNNHIAIDNGGSLETTGTSAGSSGIEFTATDGDVTITAGETFALDHQGVRYECTADTTITDFDTATIPVTPNVRRDIPAGRGLQNTQLTKAQTAVYGVRSNSGRATVWKNQQKLHATNYSGGESNTSINVGSSGTLNLYWHTLIVYPSLTDAEYTSVLDTLAQDHDWLPASTAPASNSLSPIDYQCQIDLRDYVAGLTDADVDWNPSAMSWDGTYTDIEHLANLYLLFDFDQANDSFRHEVQNNHNGWYLLDDGAGRGIEATGIVRALTRDSDDNINNRQRQNCMAHWYDISVPDGGGEGNPGYQSSELATRCLATTAIDMAVYLWKVDHETHFWTWYGFLPAMKSWGFIYMKLKSEMPQSLIDAFDQFFKLQMTYGISKLNDKNPFPLGNMMAKMITGAIFIHLATDDQDLKNLCVRLSKTYLMGDKDASLGGPLHDPLTGITNPDFIVHEGQGYDPGYQGHPFQFWMHAWSYASDESDWAWFEEFIRRMFVRNLQQRFPDPDGYWHGPAGYCCRTADHVLSIQGGGTPTELTAAAMIEDCRPFARDYFMSANGTNGLPSESEMQSSINTTISQLNSEGFDTLVDVTADPWQHNGSWTSKPSFHPPTDWFSNLNSLLDADDAGTGDESTLPTSLKTAEQNIVTPDENFWRTKFEDGEGRTIQAWVETMQDPGSFKGFFGGGLQFFWAEGGGAYIGSGHDKAGPDGDLENTDYWPALNGVDPWGSGVTYEDWATMGLWGKDGGDVKFATVRSDRLGTTLDNRTVVYSYQSGDATQVIYTYPMTSATRADDNSWTGSLTHEVTHQKLVNGQRVAFDFQTDQQDSFKEFWCTIPVYRRYWGNNGAQDSSVMTTIEYWDGSDWQVIDYDLILRTGTNWAEVNVDRRDEFPVGATPTIWGDGVSNQQLTVSSVETVKLGSRPQDDVTRITFDSSLPAGADGSFLSNHLTQRYVATQYLRLGRDFGSGPAYAYVVFGSEVSLRLAGGDWKQVYQTDHVFRDVHVDLHPDRGTTTTIPSSTTLSFDVVTTDPAAAEVTRSADVALTNNPQTFSAEIDAEAPTAGTTYAEEVINDEPEFYFKLDETSGTTIKDSSGENHDGVYAGTYTLGQSGLVNGSTSSVALTGIDGSLEIGNTLANLGALTLEVWFKPSEIPASERSIVEAGSAASGVQVTINSSGVLTLYHASADITLTSSTTLQVGQTYHIVATTDDSTGDIALYVNGSAEATSTTAHSTAADDLFANAGSSNQDVASADFGTAYSDAALGTYDELAGYPAALSASRINTHYSAGTNTQSVSASLTNNPQIFNASAAVGIDTSVSLTNNPQAFEASVGAGVRSDEIALAVSSVFGANLEAASVYEVSQSVAQVYDVSLTTNPEG